MGGREGTGRWMDVWMDAPLSAPPFMLYMYHMEIHPLLLDFRHVPLLSLGPAANKPHGPREAPNPQTWMCSQPDPEWKDTRILRSPGDSLLPALPLQGCSTC